MSRIEVLIDRVGTPVGGYFVGPAYVLTLSCPMCRSNDTCEPLT